MRIIPPVLLITLALISYAAPATASSSAPRNVPYPGTLTVKVDATDVDRRIFRVRESIPVRSRSITLLYPQWLPGNHAPRGPIEAVTELTVTANGERVEWSRDPVDMYAFRVNVPAGASSLNVQFQFASSQGNTEQGRVVATPEIVGVQWEKMLLYPAGYSASRIPVTASIVLPPGWQYATALETEGKNGETVQFRTTSLETLVDSPLFGGKHFERADLAPGAKTPVHLNVFADSADELDIKPDQLALHRRLVGESIELFGSRHFDRYEFLLAISENFGTIGLEHHRSSENGVKLGYFKEWDKSVTRRALLAHEFTHSWNGKFRRPADLWTPNYNVPMQNSLLWVYEGQTQYWGQVLATRSGLWNDEMMQGFLAATIASLQEKRAGRDWRNLQDTTHQPIISPRRPQAWVSSQRTEDYYNEGLLLWLDVDTKLRELTAEKKSLDDFARAFFGIEDGSFVPVTYTFQDVVSTLHSIAPFDWAAYLRARLESNTSLAGGEGLARAGWRLVYKDEPSEYMKKLDDYGDTVDHSYSLGIILDKNAKLTEVVWGSPAFQAGVSTAGTLVAVNGRAYKAAYLKQAIKDAARAGGTVELLIKTLDRYRTVNVKYAGGLRYPHLERIPAAMDRLASILRARTAASDSP